MNDRLSESFFGRNTVLVARELVGKQLVRQEGNKRLAGVIMETEAYRGQEDLACHARVGKTPRTEIMFGPPGRTYIYFVYGMHWLLNFVTEDDGFPGAVLIRAIIPKEGLEIISRRRNGQPKKQWTNGPAKICQAMNIDNQLNGINICARNAQVYVENGVGIESELIQASPRVGLNSVPEPWRSIPWRFKLDPQHLLV